MWLKKRFTDTNDNDYYCHAFRGEYQPLVLSLEGTTLLTLLPVLLSQLGCWLFFA
jgi:hypothetical protein